MSALSVSLVGSLLAWVAWGFVGYQLSVSARRLASLEETARHHQACIRIIGEYVELLERKTKKTGGAQ